jgi:hypothetical protein
MNNASQRPTGTQGPLQYAPRRIRETQQPRDASTTLPANTVPSRVDEVGAESDDALPDRPLPWRGMRPPVQPVPPPPQSGRRTFATMREIALLSVVALRATSRADRGIGVRTRSPFRGAEKTSDRSAQSSSDEIEQQGILRCLPKNIGNKGPQESGP